MKNIEIEIKVKVEHERPLREFLEKNGTFEGEKRQVDEYFSPAHRDFLSVRPVREWLRLRDAGGKFSINYKNWHYNGKGESNFSDEYESGISDAETVRKILAVLNFKPIVTVDKVRKAWRFEDYEISIDDVKNLGAFIEVEYKGADENTAPEQITAAMMDFLTARGCGAIQRNFVGYPFLLLFGSEKI